MRKEARRKTTIGLVNKAFLVFIFIALCFIVYHFGPPMLTGFAIFGNSNQSDFDQGTYDNTEWSVDHVQLTSGNTSGTYTSKIFDVGEGDVAIWNNMTWNESLPNLILVTVDGQSDFWLSNNGVTWTLVKDDYNSGESNNPLYMVMDSNKNLYIVEGDDDVWSSSGGETWTKVNDDYNGEGQHLKAMTIDSSDNLFIIEGDEDVWKSTDSGSSWTKVNDSDFNGGNGNAKAMAAIGTDLYVVDGAADVWKSIDSGVTWTLVKDDYNAGDANGAKYMAVDSNNNLFIAYNQDVWKSTDSGQSWTKVNDDYNGGEGQNAKVMAIDSNNNIFIIEGDEDVWKSSDSGATWAKLASNFNGGNGNPKGIVATAVTTDLTFAVRSCPVSDCSGSDFAGTLTDPSGETLSVDNNRYFQYKATFSSNSALETPKLYSVTIDYTIYIDGDNPEVTLTNPADKSGNNQKDITFSYSVTDESAISNCSLVLDNVVNQTDTTITKDTTQTFSATLNVGQYNWSVTCTDAANNVGTSATRQVSIILLDEFDGDTTDLTAEDVSAIQDFTIEQTAHGKIKFLETINLATGADINSNVDISYNSVELDANDLPELNKSAEIYLYNLNLTDPRPVLNGAYCPEPQCKEISYEGGIFVFNVTSFSTYSSEETPISSGSSGGGGGSSEGGSSGSTTTTTCTENWECTAWSSCEQGSKTRTCTDANACGTTNNAPSIYEECSSGAEGEEEEEQEEQQSKGTTQTITGAAPITALLINAVQTTLGDYTIPLLIASVGLIAILSFLGISYIKKRQRKEKLQTRSK